MAGKGNDYGIFRVGNVTYPAIPSGNSLLKTLNPPIYYGLNFIQAMLEIHLGAIWNQAAQQTSLPNLNIVEYAVPYDPTPLYQEQQVKFPLLALWESERLTEPRTFSWYHHKCKWNCSYSLPPLTASQTEQLYPILNAVVNVINDRTEQGYDPNDYANPDVDYQPHEQVWSDGYSGIERLQLTKTVFRNLITNPTTNLVFPTVLMNFEVCIREEFLMSFLNPLRGIDITQQLDGYQFLQTQLDFP